MNVPGVLQSVEAYDTSLKHHQTHQLRVWEGYKVCGDPKNAEAYEMEKCQVIIAVNNFMTKLYVQSQRFKDNGLIITFIINIINQ